MPNPSLAKSKGYCCCVIPPHEYVHTSPVACASATHACLQTTQPKKRLGGYLLAALQEATCNVELAYHMDEGLKSALKESAATSVVHTVGQRVFLHNFDCKGAALVALNTLHCAQNSLDGGVQELSCKRRQPSPVRMQALWGEDGGKGRGEVYRVFWG